ncbi:MAG: choice-of-anchor L domain-containing protein [Deltaproteobacteria bacterium]|nr:choice-of-anchor L domain-containing protein [Deltaproteobacteria bacterium]
MRLSRSIGWGAVLALVSTSGCADPTTGRGGVPNLESFDAGDSPDAATMGEGTGGSAGQGTAGGPGDSDDVDDDGTPKFDVGPGSGGGPGKSDCVEMGNCVCTIPEHVPCDAGTNDPFQAMGLNCPGELAVNDSTTGPGTAIGIRSGFGNTNVYDPREGTVYAVIGSGLVSDLDLATPGGDSNAFPTHCNDDLGNFDPGGSLPAPLSANDVAGDCTANPALVGTGDCSNTVQAQFDQGVSANDYVEMRFEVQVPPDVVSFSYDFAFFSTEYPYYFGDEFNDMYVGWLESELWTGNISFDNAGNPISLNAGFLDYADDAGNLPELAGTCMRQHAGTGWLTTTAGVTGNESITVVFAVFDLSDSILDSYVFLDNFEWGCDPQGPPSTTPEG